MDAVRTGAGWTATHLAALGDGPGFRKIRSALGITAFGMNAIVRPPLYVIVGGAAGEGYVGRDGRVPDADEARHRATS